MILILNAETMQVLDKPEHQPDDEDLLVWSRYCGADVIVIVGRITKQSKARPKEGSL